MNIEQLEHLGVLKIEGDDAETFLQGQLSNDVTALNDTWHFSAYCSPKGRALALMQIWRDESVFYALIDKSLIETTTKRLRMYVMRSKVQIEQMSHCKLYGGLSRESIQKRFANLNTTNVENGVVKSTSSFSLNIGERVIVVDLKGDLDSGIETIEPGQRQWLAADITAALPRVTEQSYELFIPQMLNLDLLNGISFKKGCYTGQEIVARMHYLGKLKQRMFICELSNTNSELSIGQKIYSDIECTKAAGSIVSCVEGLNTVLAVLRLANQDQQLFLTAEQTLQSQAVQAYQIPAQGS